MKDTDIFPPQCGSVTATNRPNQMILMGSRDTTMEVMADSFMVGNLGRPVVDETGLSGKFDYTLEWTHMPRNVQPDAAAADPGGTTFLEAVREQLGLKLKAGKAPLRVLVVDHVERPSAN